MVRAPAVYPRDVSTSSLGDRAATWAVTQGLRQLAERDDAVGRGTRALLHCWRAAHDRAAQVLPCGVLYVETCPAYLGTLQGMTRWAARVAWKAAQQLVGWLEVTAAEAVSLGASLRPLPPGKRRGGRHLLLHPWQAMGLRIACGAMAAPAGPQARTVVLPRPAALGRLQAAQGPRTVAVCCPAHSDRHPSLVLWGNGGGQCMACGWRVAWVATASQLVLHPAQGQRLPAQGAHHHSAATTNTPPRGAAPSTGPVGGLVATRSSCTAHVGATLAAWQDKASRWQLARSPGHRLAGDPAHALAVAERRSAGPAATDRAQVAVVAGPGLPGRALLPDRLMSVSCMGRASWRDRWEARVQRWMLVDLDDVQGLDSCGPALGSALAAAALADHEVGQRVAVVRTGPTGLQVWVELAAPRHSPATWCRLPEVRRWHASLGARLLAVAHGLGAAAGHPDASVCAAGRFGRRPGWRVVRGKAYRSHLLALVA